MRFQIRPLLGEDIELAMGWNTRIEYVKAMIRDTMGIPTDRQRLRFAGGPLKDGDTLAYYPIQGNLLFLFDTLRGFIIFIKPAADAEIMLQLEPTARIEDVKAMIQGKAGMPVDRQCLRFDGMQLEDGRTLHDYSIGNCSTLRIFEPGFNHGSIRVFVKLLNGERASFFVEPTTRIEYLKAMIEDATGTPPYEQRLVFAGKTLEQGNTLQDYRIEKDSTCHMVLTLRG